MTSAVDLGAYLARIGYSGDTGATAETLRRLMLAHVAAIPFENLDPLAGRPVRLDLDALQDKLVGSRRGGYCFEQNLLFAAALRALGFEVACLAARVGWNRPKDAPPPPRTHTLLHVALDEGPFIADVGFGGMTPTAPLRLETGIEQATPHEAFRLVRVDDDYRLEALVGGTWTELYQFDMQRQTDADLDMMNHYTASHPNSVFVGSLSVARVAPGRRLALRDNRLATHRADGRTERTILASAAEIRAALADVFELDVPDDPRLDMAFERFAADGPA
jgi:N-hydroxyarylamine O-acetyltransferase